MKFPVGLRINAEVNNVTKLGIFVTLPHHHHGLIHHKDFGERWNNMKDNFDKGQEVRVVVINNQNGKLALSLSHVNDPSLVDPTNQFNDNNKFAETLTKLVSQADKEIKQLQEKN
ncbi:putative RNA-binding protein with RPS1 domain [Lactobacillus colini]|uniref:RNA-binding protein with RPS1 domain n=1 Tax=Lactobacillus colini TaxID=1819254 RepID=A0ABS4MC62_9LACO|nr:S1 RNA-binding domain-containing protein [Lactobacillus colini]MBP2057280.1 putative RNA-binding protein with RPS1 domain [Lactobacillus colini]